MMDRIIWWVNTPRVQLPLRLTLDCRDVVRVLVFSQERARFGFSDGSNVVVSDSTTGFTLSTLSCGSCVYSTGSRDKIIAARLESGEIKHFSFTPSGDWRYNLSHPGRRICVISEKSSSTPKMLTCSPTFLMATPSRFGTAAQGLAHRSCRSTPASRTCNTLRLTVQETNLLPVATTETYFSSTQQLVRFASHP